jgi:hypothetical protein
MMPSGSSCPSKRCSKLFESMYLTNVKTKTEMLEQGAAGGMHLLQAKRPLFIQIPSTMPKVLNSCRCRSAETPMTRKL